jgi:hypothetical protein
MLLDGILPSFACAFIFSYVHLVSPFACVVIAYNVSCIAFVLVILLCALGSPLHIGFYFMLLLQTPNWLFAQHMQFNLIFLFV